MANAERKVSLKITADNRASGPISKVKEGLQSIIRLAGNVALAITGGFVAGATVFAGLAAKIFSVNDALAKSADRLGVTTEELASLRHAGKLAGLEVTELDRAIQFMLRSIAQAAEGGKQGEAFAAMFSKLGVTVEQLRAMSPGEAFEALVGGLQKVGSESERVNIAMRLFGETGTRVLNMTADGIRQARVEAEQFGIAIDRATAAKMENILDNIERLKASIQGSATVLVSSFAPAIETASNKVAEFARNGQLKLWALQTAQVMTKAFQAVIQVIGGVGEAVIAAGRGLNFLQRGAATALGGFAALQLKTIEGNLAEAQRFLDHINTKIADGTATPRDIAVRPQALDTVMRLQTQAESYRAMADTAVESYGRAEEAGNKLAEAQGTLFQKAEQVAGGLDSQLKSLQDQIAAQESVVAGQKLVEEASKGAAAASKEMAAASSKVSANTLQAARMMEGYSEVTKQAIRDTQALIDKSRELRGLGPIPSPPIPSPGGSEPVKDLRTLERTE